MHNFSDEIISLLKAILGDPKTDYSGNGWYEFNCPNCADINNGCADNKFNLAVNVNVDEMYCHCWKCGFANKLSLLIKRYGSENDSLEFKELIKNYKESSYYNLSENDLFNLNSNLSDEILELPNGFKLINKEDENCQEALDYLYSRGVGDDIIKKYNIGYVGGNVWGKYQKRIVIPSYDTFDNLNYWVARDYTNENKWKILNAKVNKKDIVFNERFINWYEPITLVEGPFDHIVTPNSIPLLGKSLSEDNMVFKALLTKAFNDIIICLDPDAIDYAYKIYKFLIKALPNNKIRIVDKNINGYDLSEVYEHYKNKGVLKLLRGARELHELDLIFI